MLDFWTSYFSVFFENRENEPTISEIIDILKLSKDFEILDTDYTPKDYNLWELWSFSCDIKFSEEITMKFEFMLRKIERWLDFIKQENDIFNSYIMSPNKDENSNIFAWDLWIISDLKDLEIEGYMQKLKVVKAFYWKSEFFRDNSSYKIHQIEKVKYFSDYDLEISPRETFRIHIVWKKYISWNKNWIHTHWLERFWFSEIELLDVPEEFIPYWIMLAWELAISIIQEWEPTPWEKFDIFWWNIIWEFLPFDEAREYFKKWFFWDYPDRKSHWNILSNVFMIKNKTFFWDKYENIYKYWPIFFDNQKNYDVNAEYLRLKNNFIKTYDKFVELYEKNKDNKNYVFKMSFLDTSDIIKTCEVKNINWKNIELFNDVNNIKVLKKQKEILEWVITFDDEDFYPDNFYKFKP